MRFTTYVWIVIVLALSLSSSRSLARTWQVARDGTGDFSVLQTAVDTAAPGDTIRIGPGDYTEFAPFPWDDVATGDVYVGIRTDNLTLIGCQRDSVRIGPLVPDYRGLQPKGIAMKLGVATRLQLRSLTVRNVADGLYLFGWADVRDVTLDACVDGASLQMDGGATVEACSVHDCLAEGIVFWPPAHDLLIADSSFAKMSFAVGFVSTTAGTVRNCRIHDVSVGVQYQDGASGSIENSVFQNIAIATISGRRNTTIDLQGNQILSGPTKVDIDGSSVLTGSRNVFGASNARSFYITGGSTVALHQNHILPGPGSLVILDGYSQSGPPITLDFSNNYWGTADSATVASKIWDGNDDPAIKGFVQFTPMLDHPVATERKSVGSLKALFGGGGQE